MRLSSAYHCVFNFRHLPFLILIVEAKICLFSISASHARLRASPLPKNMKSSFRLPCCLFFFLLLTACSKAPPPEQALRPVLTASVQLLSAQNAEQNSYPGEIRSRYETPMSFRVAGKVQLRFVDAGSQVKAGDLLAKLDPADSQAALAAASAQEVLSAAEAQRFRELKHQNFVSQAALDTKEAALKANRAQADLARNQSAYTFLYADHAGVVAEVLAEVGQVVAAGQTVIRLAQKDTLEVALSIPEIHWAALNKQFSTQLNTPQSKPIKAEVRLWSDDKASYSGVLRELAQVADPLTRTYAARVAIADPEAKLALGMSANVRFLLGNAEDQALLEVPMTAIFQHNGQAAVWVVGEDERITLRPVKLLAYGQKSARLSAADAPLKEDEKIVIAGVHQLADGQKIRPVEQVEHSEPNQQAVSSSDNSKNDANADATDLTASKKP